jgi:CRP-like cAMP-binding protein
MQLATAETCVPTALLTLRRNQVLYRQAHSVKVANYCYRVQNGVVLLRLDNPQTQKSVVVALVETGEYFGEETYLALGERRHTAVALQSATVERVCVDHEVLTAMLHDMSHRQHVLETLLSLNGAAAKAAFLQRRFPHLVLTKLLIAEMLGMSREGVSRTLRSSCPTN